MKQKYGIHWFRRDLRLSGNLGFIDNFKQNSGAVLGIFFLDPNILKREDLSPARLHFFLKSLEQLREELHSIGSDLLVLQQPPAPGFTKLLTKLKTNSTLPHLISFSRDYEPFALNRDADVKKAIQNQFSISVETHRDHLLIEPNELSKSDGSFYQVFTPFSIKWMEHFRKKEIQNRIQNQKIIQKNDKKVTWKTLLKEEIDTLDKALLESSKKCKILIPDAGFLEAMKRIKKFHNSVETYHIERDIPSVLGTSSLSPYLKTGSITAAQIIYELGLQNQSLKEKNGPATYLKELIWREFYYHILYHRPDVEHQSFNPKYRNLKWENNKKNFEAWAEGQTGFPIVDAGMRQLKQTGWMHNRVRMIVASFLTKDLLIDWRWGEKHFMKHLLDGDLAANNGGWQWAASTGCDPQPYFRIFNPWLQAERFDPDAIYIKKYIPELATLSAKEIHSPNFTHKAYASRIVDHQRQKLKALALYKT